MDLARERFYLVDSRAGASLRFPRGEPHAGNPRKTPCGYAPKRHGEDGFHRKRWRRERMSDKLEHGGSVWNSFSPLRGYLMLGIV